MAVLFLTPVVDTLYLAWISHNGTAVAYTFLSPSAVLAHTIQPLGLIYLAASEYLELWAKQISGGDDNVSEGIGSTYLCIHRLS